MKYTPVDNEIFASPFIGNGELTLQLSPDGSMSPYSDHSIIRSNPSRRIWWESRRKRTVHTKPLIPFGLFTQSLVKNGNTLTLVDSEETLDCLGAKVCCDTRYNDGTTLHTKAFVHIHADVVALEKTFAPSDDAPITYTFTYRFAEKQNDNGGFPEFVEGTSVTEPDGGSVSYRITDQKTRGKIRVLCDIPVTVHAEDNGISLSLTVTQPLTAHFYLIFADTNGVYSDFLAFSDEKAAEIRSVGYDGFYASHAAVWKAYYEEGYAAVGDKKIDDTYVTAQYHLRIFATRWSMPVGINDTTWEGKFFAFDEHYMFSGLLTSNHLSIARRVPDFRAKGLPIAVTRFSSKGQNEAYYPWETIEDGTEASTPGHWYEHIFHMAVITLTEYEYYRFSMDEDFLKNTAWKVIQACAELFFKHYLYRIEGGKLIVGKCTDLERLGSSVENAYMTTCGVICTFRIFAACARHLGEQLELADSYEKAANELYAGLPVENGRFVPYPNCPEQSIAVFTGTYPFDVIARDDERQTLAIADFVKDQDTFGNMYKVGSGVCSWYACWKAIAFARLKRAAEACAELDYVAATSGNFNELFEINNKASRTFMHPWFTTAAGKYVNAVNEILLRSNTDGSEIELAPALDERFAGFSFKLAARGGLTVEAKSSNGSLSIRITGNENCRLKSVHVRVPERYGKDCTVAVL